jgi:spore coat protein U-like protein
MSNSDQFRSTRPVAARIARSGRAAGGLRKRMVRRIVGTQFVVKGAIVALWVAAVGLVPAPVLAANTTTTFNVTANVPANCALATVNDLAFGPYNPGSGNVSATTHIYVNCTKGTPFSIGLNGGTGTGNNSEVANTRFMTSGANLLQYGLYTDAAWTTNWGNTTGVGGTAVTGTGTGMGNPQQQDFQVYGQIQDSGSNLAAAAGSYNDTITVTLTW